MEQNEPPSSAISKVYGAPRSEFKIVLAREPEEEVVLHEHMKVQKSVIDRILRENPAPQRHSL